MRTKLSVLPLLVALLASLIAPVLVQGAVTDLNVVGQIGGVTNTSVLSGGQLYFNVGPRIVRMAVSDATPLTPTLPGTYGGILPGIPVDIKVANGFVYVAMGRAGVAVVDGTTLLPLGIQVLPSTAYAAAVAVGTQRLYVAAGMAGIVSYDLGSDKKSLTYSATDAFSSPVRNVTDVEMSPTDTSILFAAANNFTSVLADRGGVLKFDVSGTPDPGAPAYTAGQIDINALAVADSMVYAAGDDTFYALGSGLDISGTVALASPGVQLTLRPSGSYVYLTSASGIDVVNVSNPVTPTVATVSALPTGGFATGLAAGEFLSSNSTILYVADYNAGLSIVTSALVPPENLAMVSQSYVMPKPAVASVVAGANQQGWPFSNSTTLWTVSSSIPTRLSIVGTGIAQATAIRSMTTYNDLILASADTAGLLRYQINAGAEPTSLGAFVTGGTAYDAAVAWPNAVVADGGNGLTLVNINGSMSLVGNAPAPDATTGDFELVDVKGAMAYVYDNDADGHFRIYDISTPSSPVPRGWLTQTGILDLKVSGNYAFLACGSSGIKVVNVANPDAPALLVGSYLTAGPAQSLALFNGNLVIAELAAGVEVAAIAPAGTLSAVTSFPTSGSALQVFLGPGNFLFVADQDGGLVSIQSSLLGTSWAFMPLISRQ